MIRAVLDTNVIVSGVILRRGAPFAILEAWRSGAFRLVTSGTQRAELADVLNRPKFARDYGLGRPDIDAILNRLDRDAEHVTPASSVPIQVRDPDDEHILAVAFGGSIDVIVSGDKDLLILAGDARLGSIRVVDPPTFAAFAEL